MKRSYPFLITILLGAFVVAAYQYYMKSESEDAEQAESSSITLNGEKRKYRDDNTLSSILNFKDGKRHGICRSFYEDGKRLHNEIRYVEGKKHGITNSYYRNGKLYYSVNYVDGKREGVMKKYYNTGELMAEIPYEEGKPQPGLIEYQRSGNVKKIYPELVFNEIDNTAFENRYTVQIKLSGNKKNVRFYMIEFDQYGDEIEKELFDTENGISEVNFFIRQDEELKHRLRVKAVYTTFLNNPYVVYKEKNLHLRW